MRWLVVLASWGIAFFEYCFQVPVNRIGYTAGLSGAQLKTMQAVITLVVFLACATWYLKEPLRWTTIAGFTLIALGAALVYGPWSKPASRGGPTLTVGVTAQAEFGRWCGNPAGMANNRFRHGKGLEE